MEKDPFRSPKTNTAVKWMTVLPTVSAYVRSLIHNYHDSEDVIQDVAVAFAHGLDDLATEGEVVPWVLRVARHKIVDYFRRQGKESRILAAEVLAVMEQGYESVHDESEKIHTSLRDCMDQLEKRQRRLLELRYFRNHSIDEISDQLKVSSNSIYVMLSRVRAALGRCIAKKTRQRWVTS